MKLIIGLGNPGKEYEKSRHNMGFMVIDELQEALNFEAFKEEKKFKALVSSGTYNNEKIILAKPLTYMNLSGEAALNITQFFKISPADCFIIYDDLDLPLGTIRIRKNGGPGTHNGMKSLVSILGENFPRLRVGIESRGVTSHENEETSPFVLGSFTKEEVKTVKESIKKGLEAIKMAFTSGIEQAMNSHNN